MIYDVSWPLSPQTTAWPGTQAPQGEAVWSLARGDAVNFTRWTIDAHAGTHVDAPSHFLPDGATIEQLALDLFVGPCTLVDLSHISERHVRARDLHGAFESETVRLLIRTANSTRQSTAGRFHEDYVALADDAVDLLLAESIRTVGIDALSIEGFNSEEHYAHRRLLGSGVGIIEGLRLAGVPAGPYNLCCLPLAMIGSDGAPARAALLSPGCLECTG